MIKYPRLILTFASPIAPGALAMATRTAAISLPKAEMSIHAQLVPEALVVRVVSIR
jgi:hypothetical protein